MIEAAGGNVLEDKAYRFRLQVKALYRRLQRELPEISGFSTTTIQLLVAVEKSTGPIRPGQLAKELRMIDSNVAAALRSLEAQGMVVSRSDPSDGRRSIVILTDLGAQAVTKIRRSRYAWLKETIDSVLDDNEQRLLFQAGELMQRLADHVDQRAIAQPARRRRSAGS